MPTLPTAARSLDRFLPPAYVYESLQGIMHGTPPAAAGITAAVLLATGVLVLGLAARKFSTP
ncbi:MAG: hypothetical protein AB1556_06720 [Bacillota bacterium]